MSDWARDGAIVRSATTPSPAHADPAPIGTLRTKLLSNTTTQKKAPFSEPNQPLSCIGRKYRKFVNDTMSDSRRPRTGNGSQRHLGIGMANIRPHSAPQKTR